jgi:4-hydroxy-3-methylbut-2-en-1-yl diphosphate reductase
MLSELIHNPFVNEDLIRRGLRYLQTDKGVPHPRDRGARTSGTRSRPRTSSSSRPSGPPTRTRGAWSARASPSASTTPPACWSRRSGRPPGPTAGGLHGRHPRQARARGDQGDLLQHAALRPGGHRAEHGGDPPARGDHPRGLDRAGRARFPGALRREAHRRVRRERDLERVAVVNQTTLLMNETREIIAYLRDVFAEKFGPDGPGGPPRRGPGPQRHALLRDAGQPGRPHPRAGGAPRRGLRRRRQEFVEHLPALPALRAAPRARAFFIQSEANILSPVEAEHYVFPAKGVPGQGGHRGAPAALERARRPGPGRPEAHPGDRGRIVPGRHHPAGHRQDKQLLPARTP